jgi:hypothetical protein
VCVSCMVVFVSPDWLTYLAQKIVRKRTVFIFLLSLCPVNLNLHLDPLMEFALFMV